MLDYVTSPSYEKALASAASSPTQFKGLYESKRYEGKKNRTLIRAYEKRSYEFCTNGRCCQYESQRIL